MEYIMPYIEGIDWERAFHYMPDKRILLNVIGEIVASAASQTDKLIKLKNAVEKDPSGANFREYSVQAHSMKTTLRSIGSELSEEALLLEEAGNDNSQSLIVEKTDPFVRKYLKLTDMLKVYVSGEKKPDVFDKEEFLERIDSIRKAMEAFDINTLQSDMRFLLDMDIPDFCPDEVRSLEAAVRDLDTDRVMISCDALYKAVVQQLQDTRRS
ncbi:MAG: hypothetical protein K6B28_05140 [Lachnospiraceae bacterium]|nr:hypothetical protein [Lachnospiraceae bacterium]